MNNCPQWSELAVPEQAGMLVAQIHALVRPILPTPELQQFADSLNEYLLKVGIILVIL